MPFTLAGDPGFNVESIAECANLAQGSSSLLKASLHVLIDLEGVTKAGGFGDCFHEGIVPLIQFEVFYQSNKPNVTWIPHRL
jgi:hypothetical protein